MAAAPPAETVANRPDRAGTGCEASISSWTRVSTLESARELKRQRISERDAGLTGLGVATPSETLETRLIAHSCVAEGSVHRLTDEEKEAIEHELSARRESGSPVDFSRSAHMICRRR